MKCFLWTSSVEFQIIPVCKAVMDFHWGIFLSSFLQRLPLLLLFKRLLFPPSYSVLRRKMKGKTCQLFLIPQIKWHHLFRFVRQPLTGLISISASTLRLLASAPLLGRFSSQTGPFWHKRLSASFTLCTFQQHCCLFSLCEKCWKSTKWTSAISSPLRFVHSARKDDILVSSDDSEGEREQPAQRKNTSNEEKLRYAAGRDGGDWDTNRTWRAIRLMSRFKAAGSNNV